MSESRRRRRSNAGGRRSSGGTIRRGDFFPRQRRLQRRSHGHELGRNRAIVTGFLAIALVSFFVRPGGAAPDADLRSQVLFRLDPNSASAAELALLPNIGPKTADAIVRYRETWNRGALFRSATDLENVPGIGGKTAAEIAPFLRFD